MRAPSSWRQRPGQLWGVWGVWRWRNWHSETCGYSSATKGVRGIISKRWPLKPENGWRFWFFSKKIYMHSFTSRRKTWSNLNVCCLAIRNVENFLWSKKCWEVFWVIECNLYHCKMCSWWICSERYCKVQIQERQNVCWILIWCWKNDWQFLYSVFWCL